MVQFATEYRSALDIMTADRDMNLRRFELSEKEWGMATELCDVLQVSFPYLFLCIFLIYSLYQIFKHGTLYFSRDSPNISSVIPAMDHIEEYLATACQNIKLSKAIRAALALGKETLNRYYNKTDHSDVYRIAMGGFFYSSFYFILFKSPTVLHPCHKLQYFEKAGWEDAWIQTSREIVRTEFDQTYAFMDVEELSKDPPAPSVCYFFLILY